MSSQDSNIVQNEKRNTPLRHSILPQTCAHSLRIRILGRTPLFSELSEDELAIVDRHMVAQRFPADASIYRVGSKADSIYIVADGKVKTSQVTTLGTEMLADIHVAGDLLGAFYTTEGSTHTQSACAMVDSCVLRISVNNFRKVLEEYPKLALHVLDDVTARLGQAHLDMTQQITYSVSQRVATALLRLADKVGTTEEDGSILLNIPLSRTDLAGLARSTPESVSRVMSNWKKKRIIDSGRRWTAVLDRGALLEMATAS